MGHQYTASGGSRRPVRLASESDSEDSLPGEGDEETDRLDLFRTVRERPLTTIGIVFGAGILLGLLTGGREARTLERKPRHAGPVVSQDIWERRARRLLRVARQQREELHRLGDAADMWDDESPLFPGHHDSEEQEGSFSSIVRNNFERLFRAGRGSS